MKHVAYYSIAFLFLAAAAYPALAVNIDTTLPGLTNNGGAATNPCSYIFSFYTFALMIGGILAFGAIVYGGVKYTMAAGNPSGQSEGKEWVKGALLGLLLLVGAYLILNVVNPDIVKCTLPTIGGITNGTGGSGVVIGVRCGVFSKGVSVYGSCPDPTTQTCSQNAMGVYFCITNGGLLGGGSTSNDPACKGVTNGCTLWVMVSSTANSSLCAGQGVTWNSCTDGAPRSSIMSCYIVHNC
jgi:hypothetical protein